MDKSVDHGDFSEILQRAQQGDSAAENELFETIDTELRQMAERLSPNSQIARATSLVNDAYVYLFNRVKNDNNLDLENRRFFFTSIANRMRNILIDRYRKRRPGPWDSALDSFLADFREQTRWDYEAVHELLEGFLQSEDPKKRRRHQLINLHYFCCMTYNIYSKAAENTVSTAGMYRNV